MELNSREIVAFIGRAGSGKDYQCNILKEKGFKQLAFADALRDIAYTSLQISDRSEKHYEQIKERNFISIQDSFNDSVILTFSDTPTGHYLNFRQFLEQLGTDGIRKYDNDFWCRALVKTITDNEYVKVCISDMRFINEYEYLKSFAKYNDYSFRVVFCDYHSNRYQENNRHETAIMSNWFATHGYKDLQELTEEDMLKFKSGVLV